MLFASYIAHTIHSSRPKAYPDLRLVGIPTRHSAETVLVAMQLPMPNVSRLTSLNQAHATLQLCSTRLHDFHQSYHSLASPASSAESEIAHLERRKLQTWLEQWELAFTDFLTNAMPSMNLDDITESRILKTNHLACIILSAENDHTFEAESNAIVELAEAVLRAGGSNSSRTTRTASPIPMTEGLGVTRPLMTVISRCGIEGLRTRAAELLQHGIR